MIVCASEDFNILSKDNESFPDEAASSYTQSSAPVIEIVPESGKI